MKHLIARTLTPLFLVVMWLASFAHGQSPLVIKVHIPFDFRVGAQSFAPGDYSLVEPLQHFVVLRDSRGQNVACAFTSGVDPTNPPDQPKLRFILSGGEYTLEQVWQPRQDPYGQQLFGSKRRLAIANRQPADTTLTAGASQP